MGVVYTAFDTKLQRKVAVKRLRDLAAAASTETTPRALPPQAQLLASLSAPKCSPFTTSAGSIRAVRRHGAGRRLADGRAGFWRRSRAPAWRRILTSTSRWDGDCLRRTTWASCTAKSSPENILVARSAAC